MDEKGRDAKLLFAGKPKTKNVFYVTAKGIKTESTRVLKTTLAGCYDGMLASYGSNEKITEALISDNPEVDLKRTGMKISGTSRLYINNKLKPAFRVSIREIIRNTQGEKMEERRLQENESNITDEIPLMMGQLFKKSDFYNKVVFEKKYQLFHVNGLTFEFLFDIAKKLNEENSLMMVGAGKNGKEPLVFQDGGIKYRGFLEGRIKGDQYLLILHLSNLELKDIE